MTSGSITITGSAIIVLYCSVRFAAMEKGSRPVGYQISKGGYLLDSGRSSWKHFGGAGALARAEAPASASGSGTRASRAVQGDRPTKPRPARLPESSDTPISEFRLM